MSNKKILSFLKELTALTKKYRIDIGGCGCCGSPSLEEVSNINDRIYTIQVTYHKNKQGKVYATEYSKLTFEKATAPFKL